MARYRAIIEYDGSAYAGFQRQTRRVNPQKSGPATVQETLEATLDRLTGVADGRVLGAGWTDTGVHATGQVIAFDSAWGHDEGTFQRALNALLPEDIVVRTLAQAADDFHPRYSARSRAYRYTFYVAPVRPAVGRAYAWHMWRALDVAAMNAATASVWGTHDFSTFGRPPHGDNAVRTVLRAGWRAEPPYVFFEIEANAFLYRMVRSLVGTLRLVGVGELSVTEFTNRLTAADRQRAGPTAPPHGLCLTDVTY